jgi:hypothetical protein
MHQFSLGRRAILVISLATAGCVADGPVEPTTTAPSTLSGTFDEPVRITRVGRPIWRPVDFHLFSGPIGSPETGFAEFLEFIQRLLPRPEHRPVLPELGVGPGVPHDPPYRRELARGVAALDLEERRVFPISAFSKNSENGVYLVWMLVPAPGVTGRSPDFESGPVIPNSLFPLVFRGRAFRNGELFDPFLVPESEIPALDGSVRPRFSDMDGHSHLPVFVAESHFFAPPKTPIQGRYRYNLVLRDQAGNGWNIVARFVVRSQGGASQ